MQRPRGAFAPVPTPLDARLEFDAGAQRAHLQWLAGEGLDGALVLGTNGEFPSFSTAERREIAEAAGGAGARLQLMLGVGSCALPEVVDMLMVALDSGYGSALCPPPFYFRAAPVTGIADFFLRVLDETPLPVLLYHIPQVTGVAISDELLARIGDHDNLAGVKDSSDDPQELERLSRHFAGRAYFVGSDRLVSACRDAGGAGSISAAASVAPALVSGVHRGQAEQPLLDELRRLLESSGLGPSVKAVLRRAGLGAYAARPPLIGLDDDGAEELWRAFCELVPSEHRPARGRQNV